MSAAILDDPRVQRQLWREVARRCLTEFCELMDPTYERSRHSDILIEHLEAVERGEIRRLMVFEPPRHSKTYHVSERFPAWVTGRNPRIQGILASYGAELAEKNSRVVRNLLRDERWPFPDVRIADDSAAVNRWSTNHGGVWVAAGVGGSMTGFGADMLLIDDPVKGRAEADSETVRESTWSWYLEVARTRLMPRGKIVLCQCMTGETRVTLADGSEKDLKDIRAGDIVASYSDGTVVGAKVVRWENQGPDYVYAIRTKSGIIARANERHPFLVDRGGDLEWVRLRDLRTGDTILRAIGESGVASDVLTTAATSRQSARDTAPLTTTRPVGQAVSGPRLSIRDIDVTLIYGTDTASRSQSMRPSLRSKVGAAPYAGNSPVRTSARIGAESSALTIATNAARFADCFATTVTLPLDTVRPNGSCSPLLNTFEIIPDTIVSIESDGFEDVFDIQVEGTENFIANGLVSHNTRWHEDDLSGRILNSAGANDWTVLKLPAIAEDDDPMGRRPGAALWPEWYDENALDEIRRDLTTDQGARAWLALYQQRPTADEGGMFKRAWFETRYPARPECSLRVLAVDAAFKTGLNNDFSALVTIGQAGTTYPVLDVTHGRWEYHDLKRLIVETAEREQAHAVVIEDTASGQSVIQDLRRTTRLPIIPVKVSASKEARATAIAPTCEAKRVILPDHASWTGAMLDQLAAFPNAAHDDIVDAFVHGLGYLTRSVDLTGMKHGSMARLMAEQKGKTSILGRPVSVSDDGRIVRGQPAAGTRVPSLKRELL